MFSKAFICVQRLCRIEIIPDYKGYTTQMVVSIRRPQYNDCYITPENSRVYALLSGRRMSQMLP